MKQLFQKVKDPVEPMLNQGVYQILCSYGKCYIGQIGRSIHTCLKEHIAYTNHSRLAKSVIVEHSHYYKHLICFNQTKILASTSHDSTWLIQEALEIEKHPNNFNLED